LVAKIRVVSWNIQFGIEIETAVEVLLTHPDLRDADVVCLQEMDEEGTKEIAEALSFNYFYSAGSVHPRTNRAFGNAVLSRSPQTNTGVIELPHKAAFAGQPRVAVHAHVSAADMDLTVCSVHAEIPTLTGKKRLAHFDELALASAAWPEAAVVAGDFNTITARSYRKLLRRMQKRGFDGASHGSGPTLRRNGIRYTLDHIFTRGFVKDRAGVVLEAPGSDHDPLWVTLSPTPSGSPG
jgi:endonuclease/exonuclease/phosphatase family metal-dependent hydrolase